MRPSQDPGIEHGRTKGADRADRTRLPQPDRARLHPGLERAGQGGGVDDQGPDRQLRPLAVGPASTEPRAAPGGIGPLSPGGGSRPVAGAAGRMPVAPTTNPSEAANRGRGTDDASVPRCGSRRRERSALHAHDPLKRQDRAGKARVWRRLDHHQKRVDTRRPGHTFRAPTAKHRPSNP